MTVENTPASKQEIEPKGAKLKAQTGKTWGRSRDVDQWTVFISFLIVAFCPLLVFYFYVAVASFKGAFWGPALFLTLSKPPQWAMPTRTLIDVSSLSFYDRLFSILPAFSWNVFGYCLAWIGFQAFLYQCLPSKIGYGQRTPAGYLLAYKVNGLLAWFVTHALYIVCSTIIPVFPGSIIADHWGSLLIAANIYGYTLAVFSYIKAYLFPSHPEDRKFSSSYLYDFYMGIEFNPRIGKMFDFKLFHNGRPGIIAWTLISYSFAVQQYMRYGFVTNSMVLVNFLHAMYVLDFFWCEDWYLRTIDICHDHFGFYLAWGDSVWLPFMYTIQGHYLANYPIQLSWPLFSVILGLGLGGYYIFRSVNNQKDLVRRTDGKCLIWGKPPTMIRPKFITSDGKEHHSILLTSGYWGLARHVNYFGDLMISSAMCLACGFEHLSPYFYICFMTILLLGRIARDDERCRGKYGKYWDQYCEQVPYKLIPYVW